MFVCFIRKENLFVQLAEGKEICDVPSVEARISGTT
jgi:hypothetical protein